MYSRTLAVSPAGSFLLFKFILGLDCVHSQDTILYPSCFDANAGLFEALLTADDAVISDELNHASIIDGIRLCKVSHLHALALCVSLQASLLKQCKRL
jgi:7-keto-8-aminopelargonate synthetase-like enzyme